jgi:hypothetical protein
MSNECSGLTIEDHERIGEKLKRYAHGIEQIKAELTIAYPQSNKKEKTKLERIFDDIRLVQTALHTRLLIEHAEKDDDELLPIYLGRYERD